MRLGFICVLCKQAFKGYGNNPAPLRKRGKCCNGCNATKVVPARLRQLYASTQG